MTPTQRSTHYLRKQGFIVCRVEQTLHMPGRPWGNKKDAFGFRDLLAMSDEGIALVQVTSSDHVSHRVNKIRGVPTDLNDPKAVREAIDIAVNARAWQRAGGKIFVHGWAKRGPRGKRKVWTLREEIL